MLFLTIRQIKLVPASESLPMISLQPRMLSPPLFMLGFTTSFLSQLRFPLPRDIFHLLDSPHLVSLCIILHCLIFLIVLFFSIVNQDYFINLCVYTFIICFLNQNAISMRVGTFSILVIIASLMVRTVFNIFKALKNYFFLCVTKILPRQTFHFHNYFHIL